MSRVRVHAGRCVAVAVTATLAALGLLAWLVPHLATVGPEATSSFEMLLLALSESAAAVAICWLWALVLLVVRDALRGRSHASAPRAPAVLRRLVLAGCGLSLAGGLLAPAHAGADEEARATAQALVGLAVPDRMPTTRWQRAVVDAVTGVTPGGTTGARRASPGGDREVVVSPGDSLWSLASGSLPDGADPEAVARRWHRIYRENRTVIGADPHLILPGQRLVLPGRPDRGEES